MDTTFGKRDGLASMSHMNMRNMKTNGIATMQKPKNIEEIKERRKEGRREKGIK